MRQDPYAKYGGKVDPYEKYGGTAIAAQPPQQTAAPPPEPLPTKAWPMSLGEAVKRYATGGIPNVLFGAATAEPNVQSELMKERVKGVPEAVTGIPDMMRSLAPIFRPLLAGIGGMPPSAEDIRAVGPAVKGVAKGVAKGVVDQVRIPAQGAAALIAPESVPAPSDEEFRQHARGQGNALGGAAIGLGAKPVIGKVSKYIREAPVRKGYTNINPTTLKPEPPVPALKAEIGVKPPKIAAGAIVEFDEPVRLASKALGGDASLEVGDTLHRVFNEAFPDLKHAQQQNPFLRGAMDSPQKFRASVQWARNRVWREGMEPAFKAAGEVDLSPVALQLISEIPESIRVKTPARARGLEKAFMRMFDGKIVKAETLHEFAKEARAAIQSKLAKNAFDRQAAFGTPDGKMAESFNTALRDRLYQHVQERTGVDLRPTSERYGALSELEQTALGLSAPKSLLEQLFTSYTFPTQRAIAARVGERIGQHMISDMKLLEKAFNKYKLEPQKITQPFRLRAAAPVSLPTRH